MQIRPSIVQVIDKQVIDKHGGKDVGTLIIGIKQTSVFSLSCCCIAAAARIAAETVTPEIRLYIDAHSYLEIRLEPAETANNICRAG